MSVWQDKQGVTDVSELIDSVPTMSPDDPALAHVAPELRDAFISGHAPVHDTSAAARRSSRARRTGTRAATTSWSTTSSSAVADGTLPPVNAWTAARFTLPGIIAHQSALPRR